MRAVEQHRAQHSLQSSRGSACHRDVDRELPGAPPRAPCSSHLFQKGRVACTGDGGSARSRF